MRILFFALLPATCLALDLTPRADFKVLEGFRIPVVSFDDSGRKIQWSPPANWQMEHENGILALHPKDSRNASMQLRVIPRASSDREVLGKVDALLAYCARFLPAEARELKFRGTHEGPFTIGPIPAREYLIDAVLADRSIRSSVSILDLSERERFVLVITAPEPVFEQIRNTAIQSMFSWQPQ